MIPSDPKTVFQVFHGPRLVIWRSGSARLSREHVCYEKWTFSHSSPMYSPQCGQSNPGDCCSAKSKIPTRQVGQNATGRIPISPSVPPSASISNSQLQIEHHRLADAVIGQLLEICDRMVLSGLCDYGPALPLTLAGFHVRSGATFLVLAKLS